MKLFKYKKTKNMFIEERKKSIKKIKKNNTGTTIAMKLIYITCTYVKCVCVCVCVCACVRSCVYVCVCMCACARCAA